MDIQPTYDNLIVERDVEQGVSKGGIIIPDSAKAKTNRGVVLEVGPGRYVDGKLQKPPCERGAQIIFSAYGGMEFDHGDKKYVLLAAKDVLAVMK